MANRLQLSDVSRNLRTLTSVIIVLPRNPLVDQVCASLALAGVLQSQGIGTQILCSSDVVISGLDAASIRKQAQGRQLVISWPYDQDSVDQITTEVDHEAKKFNVIIHSRPGFPPIDHAQFSYTYAKPQADTILYVEAEQSTRSQFPELTSLKTVVSELLLNSTPRDSFGGDIFISDGLPLSYTVYQLAQELKVSLTPRLATVLLRGIEHRTQGFRDPNLPSDMFIAVGNLLKIGGKRQTTLMESPILAEEKKLNQALSESAPITPKELPVLQNQQTTPSGSKQTMRTDPDTQQQSSKPMNTDQMVRERAGIPTSSAGLPEWMRPPVRKGS